MHAAIAQQTAPDAVPPANLLPVGSTVHIRTMGRRKPAVPHTIEDYIQGADGTWQFKARDYTGEVYIDTIDALGG